MLEIEKGEKKINSSSPYVPRAGFEPARPLINGQQILNLSMMLSFRLFIRKFCTFSSVQFSIYFQLSLSGTRGDVIFSFEFQSLCVTLFQHIIVEISTVLASQPSPFLPDLMTPRFFSVCHSATWAFPIVYRELSFLSIFFSVFLSLDEFVARFGNSRTDFSPQILKFLNPLPTFITNTQFTVIFATYRG